jgi:hypothetical protein
MKNAEEADDHHGASCHPVLEERHQRELEAKARVALPVALVLW